MTTEKIEILPVSLLDQNRPLVEEIKRLAASLGIGLGWHYLLDLSWIISQLGDVRGKRIMDAGAGTGLMQWYLAEHGAEVISVDRGSRADLSLRYRARYRVGAMRPEDLSSPGAVWAKNVRQAAGGRKILAGLRGALGLTRLALPVSSPGRVTIYNQDLRSLPLVADRSLDAVVAVSALEHNTPEGLALVVTELMRTLKPGGLLLATLGAGRDADWFHDPSKGWNYTDVTLRRLFALPTDTPSNYSQHDELLAALKACAELRDNLAPLYFQSGDNGMPWGKWDPQYQPVGVCKVKVS